MLGRTNVGGGGGAGNAIGYIGVSYPSGATVTCTKGSKTLRAKDTSGLFVFAVPEIGTWTVTATDGTDSATQNVEITTMYQDVLISLSFWDGDLFYNGNQYTSVTGGWALDNRVTYSTWTFDYNKGSIGSTIAFTNKSTGSYCAVQAQQEIDLTNVSSLTVNVDSISASGSYYLWVGVRTSASGHINSNPPTKYYKMVNSTGVQTIDLSSVTGSYFIALGATNVNAVVSRVRLNF